MNREPDTDEVLSLYSVNGLNNNEDTKHEKHEKNLVKKDLPNIILLCFLYVIQAIPIGVNFSIPLILISRKVSYADQGTFSFTSWPFSMKILFAPLVDAFFVKKIGRRKTWIIFGQLTNGILMLSLAKYINNKIDPDTPKYESDIYILTLIFFIIVLISTLQDIALDAWSLDLLLEKNSSFQVFCNTIGLGIGRFIGNGGFLILESKDLSNKYIRPIFGLQSQKYGFVTIERFFYFFGSISILVSILLLIFKNEYNLKKMEIKEEKEAIERHEKEIKKRSIFQTYKIIWKILLIKPIRVLILIMATYKIAFSTESVLMLKLVERGVAREKLSVLSLILSPVLTLIPFLIAKANRGPKPLHYFRISIFLRLIVLTIFCTFIYFMHKLKDDNNEFSYLLYFALFAFSFIAGIFSFICYLTLGAYCAKITDRFIGATYLTFLGFWPNIGSTISRTTVLYLINLLTFKKCELYDSNKNYTYFNQTTFSNTTFIEINKCSNDNLKKMCANSGGKCITIFDSFYPLTAFFVFIGIIWLIFTKRLFNYLHKVPIASWSVI